MTPNVLSSLEDGNEAGGSLLLRSAPRYVRFGPFHIDQQRQEVFQSGTRLKLQGKVYQVLMALVERPGEVVTREELRQRLWPADTQVNYDANVNTTVNKLRQALGDSSDKPLYVETIPRKGYCFVAHPEFSDQPVVPPSSVVPSAPRVVDSVGNQKPEDSGRLGTGSSKWRDSSFWISVGMIGLVLAGMVLGACIATLWNTHMAPVNLWP
jgi:DNA-binding winged helix-turn-helix (wHTH) protein